MVAARHRIGIVLALLLPAAVAAGSEPAPAGRRPHPRCAGTAPATLAEGAWLVLEGRLVALSTRAGADGTSALMGRLETAGRVVAVSFGRDDSPDLRRAAIAVGQTVTVTGPKVDEGGEAVVLARRVRRGSLEIALPPAPRAASDTSRSCSLH
jgi:hypothetical protein